PTPGPASLTMRCLPFTKRIEGDYSCEVKGNDRIATGLKTDCRRCTNCRQRRPRIDQELQPKPASPAVQTGKSATNPQVTITVLYWPAPPLADLAAMYRLKDPQRSSLSASGGASP